MGLGAIVGVGANWRKSGRAIRVAPVSFAGVSLRPLSVAGIVVASREMLDLAIVDDTAAETLSSLLRDAVRRELDSVFCGTAAAVADEQPAGIGYSAQTIASTGSTVAAIATDVRSTVSTMVGGGVPLGSSFFALSSEAHSFLASLGILGASGTTLAGRPIVTDCPSGTFLLIAADFLSYARSDEVTVAVSTAGTVEMDSAPSGDSVTPAAASSNFVSLFASDAIALRAVLNVDWALSGPEDGSPSGKYAAVALTGTSYA
jgi:hypothetical protein